MIFWCCFQFDHVTSQPGLHPDTGLWFLRSFTCQIGLSPEHCCSPTPSRQSADCFHHKPAGHGGEVGTLHPVVPAVYHPLSLSRAPPIGPARVPGTPLTRGCPPVGSPKWSLGPIFHVRASLETENQPTRSQSNDEKGRNTGLHTAGPKTGTTWREVGMWDWNKSAWSAGTADTCRRRLTDIHSPRDTSGTGRYQCPWNWK